METLNSTKTAFVLSIGNANPNTGKTQYDWNLYDEFWNNKMWAFLCNGFFIFSANEDDFSINEEVILRNNDGQRKIKSAKIIDKCIVNRDTMLEMLLKNKYDYYPVRAFKKKRFDRKLITSYSVKGITI